MTTPHTEGHYWAKQIKSDDVDYADSMLAMSGDWEVVQTFDNGGDTFELRVFVPGVERSESVANFQWGPRVVVPRGCE